MPSKFISFNVEVQLACRLLFVDMEGLNDGRAVKSIVPHVNPRKMVGKLIKYIFRDIQGYSVLEWQIIVHASPEATEALIAACASIRTMTKDIFSPPLGETLQIGQHTNSFSISLAEDLLNSVKMSKVSCKVFNSPIILVKAFPSLKTTRLGL